ncbi:FAD/NAD(P)-binding domain-containing protein [uncultured Corynebacterium sp.]|uniref:FAD/NAD(P)-binding protein n=1 Tax=uncultured Corynebacterium sp. TaxID=159447 RepID=UPI0025992429|nr:FAD/NAD(P)-binding protein [uncultured Corynebacterium sp.]
MPADIALIGVGPRGISTTERIAAYLNAQGADGAGLTLHLIDDAELGAGRVWETTQTHTLCMNTLAGAVTLFTEPGATVGAPPLEGPTMYEWIQLLRGERDAVSPTTAALVDAHPTPPHIPEAFAEETARTRPESNPSRALYGAYLNWAFAVALAQLPASVEVRTHRARALAITDEGDRDAIALSDGTTVSADATALASGWVLPERTARERGFADSGFTWVGGNNPVEQNIAALPAGGTVLVRGLGMGFFDLMALSTIDRGGRFVTDGTARAGVRYEASGNEPRLVVASGRGYPYLPKSEYRSLPPAADLSRHAAAVRAAGRRPGQIRFGVDLWPALVRDSFAAYYRVLSRVRPEALGESLDAILGRIDAADLESVASSTDIEAVPAALTEALTGVGGEPLDLVGWIDPLRGAGDLPAGELTRIISDGMERDIAEAIAARDSPVKAALWVMSAGRKPTTLAVENGRGAEEDRTGALRDYLAFGQMVGSGPPLFRTRELLALVDAGLVTFLGPRPVATVGPDGFTLTSGPRTAGAPVLADAFLPGPDVRRPGDPLTRSLLDAHRIRPFTPNGIPTPAPETDAATRRTIHPDGSPDPRLHIAGIPTGAQWADTTISPMPGTDAPFLQETDKVAASLLQAAGWGGALPVRTGG